MPIAALPELKASLALSLVRPAAALCETMNRPDEIVRQVRGRAVGDDMDRQRVDDLHLLDAADIDRRRVRAGDDRDALDRELHVLGGEVGAVMELDAGAQLELPDVGLDRLPARRQPRLDLQLVAGPGQRVEDMLQRLGMGAGRGVVRVDRFGPARTPIVRVWASAAPETPALSTAARASVRKVGRSSWRIPLKTRNWLFGCRCGAPAGSFFGSASRRHDRRSGHAGPSQSRWADSDISPYFPGRWKDRSSPRTKTGCRDRPARSARR